VRGEQQGAGDPSDQHRDRCQQSAEKPRQVAIEGLVAGGVRGPRLAACRTACEGLDAQDTGRGGAAGMKGISVALLFMVLGATGARAQMQPAPGQRPFDMVSGIVFYCGMAPGYAWTLEACQKLTAEFRKRAEALKIPFAEVPISADFDTRKMPPSNGFDQDKAVRVFWFFSDQSDAPGMIRGALSSTRVWEPTAKEIPNVAPGQRISVPFWIQSASFKRGARYRDAAEGLQLITDSFFLIGDKRRPG
jgi:hypothetical protein